jgi:hypothetical protein
MLLQTHKTRGFSLIEINLAIFLVAAGLLTLFALFPSGLKQIDAAHASTQEALFGEYVLSAMRAKAMTLDAKDWVAIDEADPAKTFPDFEFNKIVDSFEFPDGEDQYMRYFLTLKKKNKHVWSATLWCRSGQYGTKNVTLFKNQALTLHTQFFYSGMR